MAYTRKRRSTARPNSGYRFAAFLGLVEGLEGSGIGGPGISVTALEQYLEGASTNAVDSLRESSGYKAGRSVSDVVKVAASNMNTRVYVERLRDAVDRLLDTGAGSTYAAVGDVAADAGGFVDDVSSFFSDD